MKIPIQYLISIVSENMKAAQYIFDICNTSHRILQNSSLSDIEREAGDPYAYFFIASHKKDIEILASNYNDLVELECLIREEMIDSIGPIKEMLLEVGLTLTPLFGQYKYKEPHRITFEMSMMVPWVTSYTGYARDAMRSMYEQSLWDCRKLALAMCELLDKKYVLVKSHAQRTNTSDLTLINKDRKDNITLGFRAQKISGKYIMNCSSLLMEDAKAKAPGLDIRDLYGNKLQEALRKGNQWWKMISLKDGSLISMTKTLYSAEDRQFLISLERKRCEVEERQYIESLEYLKEKIKKQEYL